MKIKTAILSLLLLLVMCTSMGCRLIFEPDVDAVSRLFASMPTGETRVVRELCDGDDVCRKLVSLSGFVRSDWYGRAKDFYELEFVEVAEDTGYSYVHAKIRLPGGNDQRETMLPLVFEMERIKFRWHIYSVSGIEDFLGRAERARGIL